MVGEFSTEQFLMIDSCAPVIWYESLIILIDGNMSNEQFSEQRGIAKLINKKKRRIKKVKKINKTNSFESYLTC